MIEVNLDKLDMTVKEDHSNIINITDDVSLNMKYPKIDDFKGFNEKQESSTFFDLIKKCVDSVTEGRDYS